MKPWKWKPKWKWNGKAEFVCTGRSCSNPSFCSEDADRGYCCCQVRLSLNGIKIQIRLEREWWEEWGGRGGECVLFFTAGALELCEATRTAVAVLSGHSQTRGRMLVSHLLDLQTILCQIKSELHCSSKIIFTCWCSCHLPNKCLCRAAEAVFVLFWGCISVPVAG